mmetsp:Transcript_71349/g.209159  ORF Transcript_71349/g.209159 Transcript_71349/m.209159 type:complete len:227 (-) Transcript_71349:670-1350(-)
MARSAHDLTPSVPQSTPLARRVQNLQHRKQACGLTSRSSSSQRMLNSIRLWLSPRALAQILAVLPVLLCLPYLRLSPRPWASDQPGTPLVRVPVPISSAGAMTLLDPLVVKPAAGARTTVAATTASAHRLIPVLAVHAMLAIQQAQQVWRQQEPACRSKTTPGRRRLVLAPLSPVQQVSADLFPLPLSLPGPPHQPQAAVAPCWGRDRKRYECRRPCLPARWSLRQ